MAKLLINVIGGFDENVFWLLIPHGLLLTVPTGFGFGESRMVDMIIALWLAENGCLVGLNTKIVTAQTCIANSNFITFSGRNQKTTKSLLPLLCCSQYRDHHIGGLPYASVVEELVKLLKEDD